MREERLFVWAVADLDACLRSSWHYHQLRVAGLMRLLLTDRSPLALQLNRTYRLPLLFRIGEQVAPQTQAPDESEARLQADFSMTSSLIDPVLPGGRVLSGESVNLKRFLKAVPLRVNGENFTVLDVIQHFAYVGGVTHAGAPDGPAEESLVLLRSHWRVFSQPIGHETLLAVGRVALRALAPLRDAVHAREFPGLAPHAWDYG